MGMLANDIAEVLAELRPIAGGRIQKVDRIGPREIVLSIRVPGRTLRLLVSADLQRVHLLRERPPRTVAGGGLQRALRQHLEGRPLVSLSMEGRSIEIDALETRLTVRLDDKKKTFQFLPPSGRGMPEPSEVPEHFPRSDTLAAEYAVTGPKEAENRLRSHLLSGVRKRAKKLERLEKNLERDREKLKKMAAGAALGELLKTMLHQVRRGAPEVEAVDWSTGEPVRIPLDPALSPKANMQRLFAKAKKGARGLPLVERRLEAVRSKRRALDAERARIERTTGESLIRLAERADAGEEAASAEPSRKKPEKKKPIDRWSRRFVAADGTEIRVGRGAKENDRLTLQGSRGHDIWLHARGTAGAHVLLRVEKGKSPTQDALMDAAHLAAFYSSAKNDSKVEVIQTEARNVKKTKGDPPGRVSVAKGKTILLDVDPQRLDRLLGRER